MEKHEITIGQVTFELCRVYSGTQTPVELIQAQIEREAAAFDRAEQAAV